MSATRILITLTVLLINLIFCNAYASETLSGNQTANSFFVHYLDSYNAFDAVNAASHYHDQVLVTGTASTPQYLTRADMQKLLTGFLAQQKSQKVEKFAWSSFNLHGLSDKVAIASNTASRYDAKGELVSQGAATFVAHKMGGDWKIIALNLHAPEQLIEKI